MIRVLHIDSRKLFFRTKYTSALLDHYESPRNVGKLDSSDSKVGTAIVGAPACGDVLKFQILVGADDRILESRFLAFGCGSAIASSSFASVLVKGKTIENCLLIKNSEISKFLNLPPVKLHCSMLAEDAIKAAIENFKSKQQ